MKSEPIIEKIRNKLKESDPCHRTVTNIFQFNFTDADGILIKSVELNIYDGSTNAADAEITVNDEDFFAIGSHEATFHDLLANNKAQVRGDTDAINKMMEKFRMNAKK